VDVAYDRHSHGYGDETVTNIYEMGVTYFPSDDWQIMGGYRFEQRDDRGSDDNHIVEVGLIRRF
jgi:long-subunit fatty acid transport protein